MKTQKILILCLASSLTFLQSKAETLRVPEQHVTIQSAIEAAKAGDVVLVAPGTHRSSVKL